MLSTETETVREAWFTIGGWTLAAVIAVWHWRVQIVDFVDRLLDITEDHLQAREQRAVDDHPAGYAVGGVIARPDLRLVVDESTGPGCWTPGETTWVWSTEDVPLPYGGADSVTWGPYDVWPLLGDRAGDFARFQLDEFGGDKS